MNNPSTEATFDWETFLFNLDVLIEEAGGMEQFAVVTGVRFWTLRSWKVQRPKQPTHLSLQAIADAFNLQVDDLTQRRLPKTRK